MLLGLISDAHGHVAALKRGIDVLRMAGAQRLVFLGDAVGYIPNSEAVRTVLSEGLTAVCGNHERMMLHAPATAEREFIYQHKETARQLGPTLLSAVRTWPSCLALSVGNVSVEAFHGSPTDHVGGYVYPDTDLTKFKTSAPIVVMGHTHRPFIRHSNGTLFINVGSCGLPRDTGAFGSVALLDTASMSARILRFDISDLTQEVLEKYSLHPSVVDVLRRKPADVFEGTVVNV